MHIARTLVELRAARAALAAAGQGRLTLVPTMGALHEGHLSLVDAARAEGGSIAASIFVNPTQFAASEDFTRYPRKVEEDCAMLEAAGCDLVWLPDVETMYPEGDATIIDVAGPALLWEGAARLGHFRGVATVVTKLFGQVAPDAACFGEKDWQQVQVIRRLVTDLALPVRIIPCPTLRAEDGLALSSRNRYLSAEQRDAAPMLFAAMTSVRDAIRAGIMVETCLVDAVYKLTSAGFAVDYFVLVEGATLTPLAQLQPGARLIAAARLGSTRLLDNLAV